MNLNSVDLDLYKTFYIVATHKSMSKASKELCVSQPAISKAIQSLESQLGGTIFLRSNKGLELTEEGKMLYENIKPALELICNAETQFGNFKDLTIGKINIGISAVLTKTILLDVLESFKNKYSQIKINIMNGLTSDLVLMLNQGKLDFVILNDWKINKNIVELDLLTTLKYKFFYNKKYFNIELEDIKDLNNYPFIVQNRESNTRLYLDYELNNLGVVLNPYMEVVSQDLVCELSNIGMGIGFAFEKLLDRDYPQLTKLEFLKEFESDIYIATNKSITSTFAAKEFINELKNC